MDIGDELAVPTPYVAALVEDDDGADDGGEPAADAAGGDSGAEHEQTEESSSSTAAAASMHEELAVPAAAAADAIEVTFVDPGSLGIKFVDNPHANVVQIRAINPGTQAESHTALQAGLVLRVVGGTSVVGRSYQDTIGVIKAQGRPLTCQFGPVQPLPDAMASARRTSPTASQSAVQRPATKIINGRMHVWLFKAEKGGFGVNLTDSCEVVKVGGDAAAQKVPISSRIVEVNGVPVTTKLDIKEVTSKLPPEVNPVGFVLAVNSSSLDEASHTAQGVLETGSKSDPVVGAKKMKKPMKRPAHGSSQARARRDSVALLSKSGFDGAAQMNILSTFERSQLDPNRWEEALTKLGVDKLAELASAVEAEQQSSSRGGSADQEDTQKEESGSEELRLEQVEVPTSRPLAPTFEVEAGNTQQLRSQLFESPSPRSPAVARSAGKVMQKPQARGARGRGAAMARRNSIAMMQSERGLDAFTAGKPLLRLLHLIQIPCTCFGPAYWYVWVWCSSGNCGDFHSGGDGTAEVGVGVSVYECEAAEAASHGGASQCRRTAWTSSSG
jgi:hypothetical protein